MGFKKITAAVLTVIFLGMAGCSGGSQMEQNEMLLDKDNPVTITIWHYYNGVQQLSFDEMVQEFNDTVGMEKGIIVEAFSKNSVNELAESVMETVDQGGKDAPDIFGTYAETAYLVDEKGMLADLSPYFTQKELDEYVAAYINEGDIGNDGRLMIFPAAKSTEVFVLNVTDWADFASSCGATYDDLKTWEGLTATAEKYYDFTDAQTPDVPNDGKAFFGRDSMGNYMVVGAKQLGHPFISYNDNGEVEYSCDKDTLKRLWANYYVPFVKGCFASESRFRSDDMRIGAILGMVCSNTGAMYWPTEVTVDDSYTYQVDTVILPVPDFMGTDSYACQQGAGLSVMKSDAKTEYACAVFLEWFTEDERNLQFSVNSGYLPVKKDTNDFDKVLATSPDMGSVMADTFKTAIDEVNSRTLYTAPPSEKSAEIRDFVGSYLDDTSIADAAIVKERVAAGEERSKVLEDYCSDSAFETWYAGFVSGFESITG